MLLLKFRRHFFINSDWSSRFIGWIIICVNLDSNDRHRCSSMQIVMQRGHLHLGIGCLSGIILQTSLIGLISRTSNFLKRVNLDLVRGGFVCISVIDISNSRMTKVCNTTARRINLKRMFTRSTIWHDRDHTCWTRGASQKLLLSLFYFLLSNLTATTNATASLVVLVNCLADWSHWWNQLWSLHSLQILTIFICLYFRRLRTSANQGRQKFLDILDIFFIVCLLWRILFKFSFFGV